MIQEAEAHTKEEMKKTQEILQGCDCGTVNDRPLVGQAYIHNLLKHIEQVWPSVACSEIQELKWRYRIQGRCSLISFLFLFKLMALYMMHQSMKLYIEVQFLSLMRRSD